MLKGSVVPSQIKNKAKRSQVYQEQKAEKKKEKKQERQKRKREEEEAEASGTPVRRHLCRCCRVVAWSTDFDQLRHRQRRSNELWKMCASLMRR